MNWGSAKLSTAMGEIKAQRMPSVQDSREVDRPLGFPWCP